MDMGSCYANSLAPEIAQRYQEKLQLFCDNVDPYSLDPTNCSVDVADLPNVTAHSIRSYLLLSKCPYSGRKGDRRQQERHNAERNAEIEKGGWTVRTFVKNLDGIAIVLGELQINETGEFLNPWFVSFPHGYVLCAHCTCAAGTNETCAHIGGLLQRVQQLKDQEAEVEKESKELERVIAKMGPKRQRAAKRQLEQQTNNDQRSMTGPQLRVTTITNRAPAASTQSHAVKTSKQLERIVVNVGPTNHTQQQQQLQVVTTTTPTTNRAIATAGTAVSMKETTAEQLERVIANGESNRRITVSVRRLNAVDSSLPAARPSMHTSPATSITNPVRSTSAVSIPVGTPSSALSANATTTNPQPIVLNFSNGLRKINIITAKTIRTTTVGGIPVTTTVKTTSSASPSEPVLVLNRPQAYKLVSAMPNDSRLRVIHPASVLPAQLPTVQVAVASSSSSAPRPLAAVSPNADSANLAAALLQYTPRRRGKTRRIRKLDAIDDETSDNTRGASEPAARIKLYVCGICSAQFGDKNRFMHHCKKYHTLPTGGSPATPTTATTTSPTTSPTAIKASTILAIKKVQVLKEHPATTSDFGLPILHPVVASVPATMTSTPARSTTAPKSGTSAMPATARARILVADPPVTITAVTKMPATAKARILVAEPILIATRTAAPTATTSKSTTETTTTRKPAVALLRGRTNVKKTAMRQLASLTKGQSVELRRGSRRVEQREQQEGRISAETAERRVKQEPDLVIDESEAVEEALHHAVDVSGIGDMAPYIEADWTIQSNRANEEDSHAYDANRMDMLDDDDDDECIEIKQEPVLVIVEDDDDEEEASS